MAKLVPTIEQQWAEWMQLLPEVLGWYQKAALTGISCQKRENDWILILKATRAGKPEVAFFTSDTYYGLFAALGGVIRTPQIRWRPDKYKLDVGG